MATMVMAVAGYLVVIVSVVLFGKLLSKADAGNWVLSSLTSKVGFIREVLTAIYIAIFFGSLLIAGLAISNPDRLAGYLVRIITDLIRLWTTLTGGY